MKTDKPIELFAVVAKNVIDTGKVSFGFMYGCKASFDDFQGLTGQFGLILRKPEDEVSHPDADNDIFFVFKSERGGQIFTSGNEIPFQERVKECPKAVLLMDERQFEKFKVACEALAIPFGEIHYDGNLATG